MSSLPNDISYERWVEHVFDHPVLDPQWWFREDSENWDASANHRRTLAYLTQLFADPSPLIRRYSRAQIDQGLNYVVSNSCSDHMFVLTNAALPWEDRRACFEAMKTLYSELFAPLYGYDYTDSRRGRGPEQPNYACFMWWDIIPLWGGMDHPDRDRINDAVLDVCEFALGLASPACQESALHGLGHWRLYLPERPERIVRKFLERYDIVPDIRAYAELAAIGRVP